MAPFAKSLIKKLSGFQIERTLSYKTLRKLGKQNSKTVISLIDSGIKSYHEIPTNTGLLPSSLELIFNGGAAYLHEHCDKRHKELGPIYREHLGPVELIFLSDTKLIQTVIANEGQYPHHNVPESWNFYNRTKKVERGLFFQTGEPWAKLRRVFNKVMLADANKITRFSNDILKINLDLMNSWIEKHKTEINANEIIIDNVEMELCKWSIESTGFMLFGSRMGCISDGLNTSGEAKAEELVRNVANMFSETSRFQLLPVKLAYRFNLSTWTRFEFATSNMIRIANEYVKENISKAKMLAMGHSLIEDILKFGTLSDDEISRSVVDLIIAAADTTSNSLQWMLYLLAKHQDVQSRILEEIDPLLEVPVDFNDLEKIPYLRAFIREVSRLYPTAPFLARTLDKDIVLGSYSVPAKTPIVFSLYTTSRLDKYFDQPLKFKPERWLRSNLSKDVGSLKNKNHAYASLPFGIGARMCIGRRAAELEMCLFIASFVKEFESFLLEDGDVRIKLKMTLCPSKPIKLKLKPRKTKFKD